jgi:hypothetical protein
MYGWIASPTIHCNGQRVAERRVQIAQLQVEFLPEVFKIHARAVYLDYLSDSQPMQVPRR